MIPTRQSQWEGFTLEQIRYERELNNAHIDLITHKLHKLAEPYSTPSRAASSILGRVVNAMSYIDYAVLGFKAWKHIRKWFKK